MQQKQEEKVRLNGVCDLYFETGTEGCYWAFQDRRFMEIPDPHSHTCAKCHRFWDKRRDKDEPAPTANKKLKEFLGNECAPGTHKWELSNPNGIWAREGLHILYDGDRLTVYDKCNPAQVLWSGIISLRQRKFYHEYILGGYICHSIPENAPTDSWKKWFVEGYPAELTLGERSMVFWEKHGRESVEKKLKELGREHHE